MAGFGMGFRCPSPPYFAHDAFQTRKMEIKLELAVKYAHCTIPCILTWHCQRSPEGLGSKMGHRARARGALLMWSNGPEQLADSFDTVQLKIRKTPLPMFRKLGQPYILAGSG